MNEFPWHIMHQRFPKAYSRMERTFPCLFTLKYKPNGLADLDIVSIKHPRDKRDLFDFFDSVGIEITVGAYTWSINDVDVKQYDTIIANNRSQAEDEAFIKSFEILEERA